MAINLKEIENRKYDGNEPVSFEYTVKGLDGPHGEPQEMRVWFERTNPDKYGLDITKPTYEVFTFIDDVVYRKVFGMPKNGMPLEMVVATGLNLLRFALQDEVSYKQMVGIAIMDVIKDM